MDFNKIDVKEDGSLQLQNEDGSITWIPSEIQNAEEKLIVEELISKFPLGKENYKLVDGEAIELTEEEKLALNPVIIPEPTIEERLASAEEMLTMLMEV